MYAEASLENLDNVRPARVLLCDDSRSDRAALSSYLQSRGYEVREAEGGAAALDELKTHEVDIVLLDLHMPGVSGFNVLAYLQEHRRGLPVILLSGMPLNEMQHEIRHLPVHELPPLLIKPIDVEKLTPLLDFLLTEELPEMPDVADTPESATG